MPYKIKTDETNQILRLEYSGDLSTDELKHAMVQTGFILSAKNWKKLIVDLRTASLKLQQFTLIAFAASQERVVPSEIMIAAVLTKLDSESHDILHHAMLKSLGINTKLFSDEYAALEWVLNYKGTLPPTKESSFS